MSVFSAAAQQDSQLDQQIKTIATAHHGQVAIYAHNLHSGQTASLLPDEPVQTASVIKMGILLDAAEQIRAGQAALDERIVLTKVNQVEGSGVLSDNTATNVAIDRLGLAHINETLRKSGLHQTVLYKSTSPPLNPCRPTSQNSVSAKPRPAKWPPSWSASSPAISISIMPPSFPPMEKSAAPS
ncbi:MAG TPA: serine hydrolase [Terracidiphilus sp.]|nr:serine hydrolase [Terracidiphilus sp.]